MSDVNWGNYAEAYKAIHDKLDEILTKLDYPADPAVQDVIDRADRVLGRVYGSQGQQLKQRASTHELMVQLVHQGVEYQAGGGGAGGGLVQCQIRNEADEAWINEPFARRVQGSQGQDLLQRASTYDILVQLRHDGTEIDPRQIRALTSGDVVDVSDRAARDLGHLDVDNFPSDYPLPSTQISDLKNVTVVSALPAGDNNIGNVDVVTMPNASIEREGTPSRVNTASSGQIVSAPGAGYKLILCGFVISVDADEIVRLRWGGASGSIIATLPTKGIIGMNLIGVNEASGENQNLYLEKSGSGNAQGTIWIKQESV